MSETIIRPHRGDLRCDFPNRVEIWTGSKWIEIDDASELMREIDRLRSDVRNVTIALAIFAGLGLVVALLVASAGLV